MTKKRILEFLSYAGVGGTQQMVLSFLRQASREKYEFFVCVLLDHGFVNDAATDLGIENTSLKMQGYWDLSAWWKLYRFARSKKIDVIRTYGLKAHIIGRIIGKMLGIPVNISSVRNIDPWRKWYHARLDWLTSGLTDLYISNSEAGRQATHHREHIPLSKILTIPNGIEVKDFSASGGATSPEATQAERQILGITPEDRIIGIVANLRPQKGHITIIDALPLILARIPRLKCLFVGRNDFPDHKIHRYVREKHLESHVICTGERQDIAAMLSMFEMLLLPSQWEGFPTVVIEAMAMGLPVVASPVGDISRIVVPGQTGILIPPDNPNALAEAVIFLLTHPDTATRMGQAGYTRVCEQFSLKAMVQRTEAIYDHLIAQKPRP